MNLALLSRILAQPWAIRPENLATFTHLLIGNDPMRPLADTSWKVMQWDDDKGTVVREPLRTSAGYTVFNYEGLLADRRGNLPAAPAGVSVLLVWGVLGRAWSALDRYYLDPIDLDEVASAIAATPEGSTVVLWFRSPGGIITGTPETAQAIREAAKGRRIIAFTDDLCASAAYWLASQCEAIHATPTAALGSIGVYIAFYDFCEYLKKLGIKLELFKEGELKGLGLPGNPLDEAAKEHLQASVTEGYRLFTEDVLRYRELATETMQGQTFEGEAAREANLVDVFSPSAAAFFATVAA